MEVKILGNVEEEEEEEEEEEDLKAQAYHLLFLGLQIVKIMLFHTFHKSTQVVELVDTWPSENTGRHC